MKRTVAILAMLVVSAVAPATALAGAADQQAYSGSHVAFDTGSSAVVDYTVDGEQTIESVRVQSQSTAESNLGLGASAGLEAVTAIAGSAVTLDSRAAANASLRTESGASMRAHDNGHGSLVVTADDAAQYVALNVSADSEADQASDQRVVYETDSGATAAAMVVGDGNVSVTEDGNLTAAVAEDSRLVVRSYTEARSDAEATEERMIVNETAAASVYLMQQGDATVSDTVTYGRDTSVEVSERAASRVNVTVERTASEGRVVITHVSNETFESAEDVQVAVDGEAAASASSYAELRQATQGGDSSKYMVRQGSSAQASADARVLVGINHFSTRTVTMTDDGAATDTSGDDSDGADGDDGDGADGDDGDETTTSGNGSGFGAAVALLALVAVTGVALVRRH